MRPVRTGPASWEETSGSPWTAVVLADAVMQGVTYSRVTYSRGTANYQPEPKPERKGPAHSEEGTQEVARGYGTRP